MRGLGGMVITTLQCTCWSPHTSSIHVLYDACVLFCTRYTRCTATPLKPQIQHLYTLISCAWVSSLHPAPCLTTTAKYARPTQRSKNFSLRGFVSSLKNTTILNYVLSLKNTFSAAVVEGLKLAAKTYFLGTFLFRDFLFLQEYQK